MNDKLTNKKKNEISKSIDLIEEIIWVLDANKNIKLKDIPTNLRALLNENSSNNIHGAEMYISPNPNIHFLIGVLPRLFKDEELFPTNMSIIQFAEEFLSINISKTGKRSRYELIGLIVCETDNLSDNKLISLVKALSKLVSDENHFRKIKKENSNNNFSWNETIQKLTEKNYE